MYSHSQFGWPMAIGTALGLSLATAVLLAVSAETRAAAPWVMAALYATLLLAFLLFYRLKVAVDADRIRAVFGIGLIRKEIPLADVIRADLVKTRVMWGYGIHWTPSGWLYNVAGRHAVRLEVRGGKAVMIGTDEPEALKAAVDARLAARGR
jgi:uncharacterized membrane protein YkvI